MTSKFNPNNMHRLDNPERRRILPPEETLLSMGLAEGDTFVDIGCGIGYFSIPASGIVGADGTVYGLDVSETMLSEMKSRITEKSSGNIRCMLSEPDRLPLPDHIATYVFLSNVLHEIENRAAFMNEIKRISVAGAKLGIIEWKKIITENGPPLDERLTESEIELMASSVGFSIEKKYSVADRFNIFIFIS